MSVNSRPLNGAPVARRLLRKAVAKTAVAIGIAAALMLAAAETRIAAADQDPAAPKQQRWSRTADRSERAGRTDATAPTDAVEVVLIHGLGASAAIWDSLKPFLGGAYRIFAYEIHGHGTTKPLADPTIDGEATALAAWLDAHQVERPILVGHGLGGMIAMHYTFHHPDRVARLVVIDTAPRQLASSELKASVAQQLLEDYDRFVASHYVAISTDEEICRRAVDMALRTDSTSFVSLLLSSFDWDLTELLAQSPVPMLVIGSDAYLPDPEHEDQILAAYGFGGAQNLSFRRIEGTGHYLMLEKPTYVASVIQVWLRSLRR
jgi:pimeloyl-ACP methyl ester carboxylesterase